MTKEIKIQPLTQEQVQDKVKKTLDLNNKDFKEMLQIQFKGNIIAHRQLQTLRNSLLHNKTGGSSKLATLDKLKNESLQLREAIKMGNEYFTPAEIADMFGTLGRHLKRMTRYIKVEKIENIPQEIIEVYNDITTTSKFDIEKSISEIRADIKKKEQRKLQGSK